MAHEFRTFQQRWDDRMRAFRRNRWTQPLYLAGMTLLRTRVGRYWQELMLRFQVFRKALREIARPFISIRYHARIGKLATHAPRPLHIPAWYSAAQPPAEPPLISIVTPSFNQGSFLERTLRSVLDQRYPRLQYIVQDGGSKDQSVAILERYAGQLHHWVSAPDAGQADAINRGFQHAGGDILAYLNSDDLLLPGSLAYVARYFAAHPEVDAVYGHRVLIDEEDREVGRWVMPPHSDAMLRWADYVPQETLFWRRRIWEKAGGSFDPSLRFAMDWDLMLRFLEQGGRFVRLPRFLGAFRVHTQQKTSSQMHSVGREEIARLRQRSLGDRDNPHRLRRAIRPYLRHHVMLDVAYRLGLLRY